MSRIQRILTAALVPVLLALALDLFLEKGAISQQQYNKSLHDFSEKMGFPETVET